MTLRPGTRYARAVNPFRGVEAVSRILGLASVGAFALGCAAAASADVTTIDDASAPIVRVNVVRGHVIVRTWDRPVVQIDAAPAVAIERRQINEDGGDRSVLIPQATLVAPEGTLTLGPEGFVVSTIPPGPRDVIFVRSLGPADIGDVTVTIPAGTVYLLVHDREGALDVHEYRGGTLVAFTGRGALRIADGGGTIFAQTGRGPIVMTNVNADRIRSRTLAGNATFERCTVRQIEATSIAGSIVYDAGSFAPGLARFESSTGDVAIGTVGSVQFGGRSSGGRVYTDVGADARVNEAAGTTNVGIGAGGPLVNAASDRGNVYLYSGTLHDQHDRAAPWVAPITTLSRPGRSNIAPLAAPATQQRPQQQQQHFRESTRPPQPRQHRAGRPFR